MRYGKINKDLFVNNRKNLVGKLKSNSVVVLNANDVMPTNSDGTMRFRQNSDLFYLSGVDQEETILVLCPDFPEKKYHEVLFLRETNEHIATWEGHKLTKEEARAATGIETVLWLSEFPKLFNTMMVMGNVEHVYLNTNDHYRADPSVESRDARFIKFCQQKYPLHKYERLAPILHDLRSVKSQFEIDLMQKACDITEKAFRRVLKFVKPGVKEYEIEAEYAHEFLRNGSRGFAYEPIIASGSDSCVLHYIENKKECKDGDVLLLDVGAEFANYNADLTRTIPVNGRFTQRQKDVYNAVLRVHRAAMQMLKPGVIYYDYHKEIQKLIEAELVNLKLLDREDIKKQNPDKPLFFKYYMHGTSHMLGLDVHDVGSMYQKMKAGMVWTIEPGIYIKEEGLGVRIENNVVITENGVHDLMKNIPIEVEEIEEIMNSK
ncbi:aminopeptidase P family protein [Chryseosolibacter indicus]|uniref:Xaa-Pro aminopeptidase n=1 Tax=Chryseosolibacter indicus TaxID=2782351 RepID=A0ABS5VPT6_9BACT|nr:aminopeptidase P family protein [Chryseosolibacter indicus]MBT1703151.1 aminopeptidase P family protein [Chryseosolibacter indicus]